MESQSKQVNSPGPFVSIVSPAGNFQSFDRESRLEENKKGDDEGCSVLMMLLLSTPRMASQMAWSAQGSAIGPFLQNLLPSWAVMITQFVGPVTGILVAPTFGVLSDKCTSKYGRRRPFLLAGGILTVICWTLMRFTRDIGEALGDTGQNRTWTAVFLIIFYIWMDITVHVMQTPAFLIISDFAGKRQTTGAAIGQATATMGSLMVAAYIGLFGPAHESLHEFLAFLSVVMILSVGCVCIIAKEKQLVRSVEPNFCRDFGDSLAGIWKGIVTMPKQMAIFAFMYFLVLYGFSSYGGAKGQFFGLILYNGDADQADICGNNCSKEQLAYNAGVQKAGGSTDLMFNIFGYLYSWCIPLIVSRIGMKYTMLVSLVPQMLLVFMATIQDELLSVIIIVLMSSTLMTTMAMAVPVIVHVLGTENDERMGMYVGAMNSANCAGQFLNYGVSSVLVNTDMGYALPILVGGCVTVLCGIVCLTMFKITAKTL